jgi:hypothetical protein
MTKITYLLVLVLFCLNSCKKVDDPLIAIDATNNETQENTVWHAQSINVVEGKFYSTGQSETVVREFINVSDSIESGEFEYSKDSTFRLSIKWNANMKYSDKDDTEVSYYHLEGEGYCIKTDSTIVISQSPLPPNRNNRKFTIVRETDSLLILSTKYEKYGSFNSCGDGTWEEGVMNLTFTK